MKIICNLNLFSLDQIVYLATDAGTIEPIAEVEMEQLPEVLAAVCNEYDTHEVLLSGYTVYAETIAEDVKEFGLKHYSNNNIKVEVI